MRIKDILRTKGGDVVTIEARSNVRDVIRKLNEHRIGSLVVLDEGGEIAGVVTERDILRECDGWTPGADKAPPESLTRDIMTKEVVIGVPDDELDYVMGIMTKNRIRHLPVLDGGKLVGLISIGDVVNAHLGDLQFENRLLRDYIHGMPR